MKKTSKIVALVLCLALVVTATVVVLTACSPSGHTYTGDCHYDATYGENTTHYGVKVDVSVDDEGKISAVKLYTDKESGYVRTTKSWEANTETGALGYAAAEAKYDEYLSTNFVGKKVLDVMHYDATASASGQSVGEGTPKIAGATQSSARIIVAVKDALKDIVVTGECHYTNYGHEYGAKVDVLVIDNKVLDVRLYTDEESGYVRTSADNADAGWENYDETEAAYPQWIKDTFVGKTVSEINDYVATATADGQSVGEGSPKIAGSTQSSARIIVAVKNALSKLA